MRLQQQILTLFGTNIVLDIKRTLALKSIAIKVHKNCIKIKTPLFLSNKSIVKLLKKKLNWIKKQLIIQSKIQSFIKKKYVEGENFLYLGENFKLKIVLNKIYSVNIDDNFLIVNVKNIQNTSKIKKLIKEWFRKKSTSYFVDQTFLYTKKINLTVHSVKIREYKARWGSCSINGDVSFNWRLIMAPPKIIEYVIIHELMHLKEHNHSAKYWEHVKSLYPNIKEAKEWLMYNEKTLFI